MWVGDRVRDEDTGRYAVVSDVRGGRTYILRALGGGGEWISESPERLTVTVPRRE